MISRMDQLDGVDYAVVVYCLDKKKKERILEEKKVGWRVICSKELLLTFIAQWFE